MVPKPLLYKPVLGPEVNFTGTLAKFPATEGAGNIVRLKILLNSTRTFTFTRSLNRKLRPKLAFSDGTRKPRNQRSAPWLFANCPLGTFVHAAGFSTWVLVGSKQWQLISSGSVWCVPL